MGTENPIGKYLVLWYDLLRMLVPGARIELKGNCNYMLPPEAGYT